MGRSFVGANFAKIFVLCTGLAFSAWVAKVYEVASYEALEIHEAEAPFLSFLNPFGKLQTYSDRGPVFPGLLRIYKSFVGLDLFVLRVLSLLFLGLSALFILYFPGHYFSNRQKIFIAAMVFANEYFIRTVVLVKPYSFIFFVSLLVFYFFLRSEEDAKSDRKFWVFVWVACFAIISYFTSVLLCWLCFTYILYKRRQKVIENGFAILLFLLSTVPKFFMIYKFRFVVRQGQVSFENLGHWDSFYTFKDIFGLESRHGIWEALILCTLIVFAGAMMWRHWRLAWVKMSVAFFGLTVISIMLLKQMELREIDGRYYFQLLPLFYGVVGFIQNRRVLMGLFTVAVLSSYLSWKDYIPRPYTTVTEYLIDKLEPGDLVCTPQLNGIVEKLHQTAEYYLNIDQIKGTPTWDYFSCREMFLERSDLTSKKLWIVAFGEDWNPDSGCDRWIDAFDCDQSFYKAQMEKYRQAGHQSLMVKRHKNVFISEYELRE